jgi:hypothetical protein
MVVSLNLGHFLGGIEGRPVYYEAEAREPVVVLIGTTTPEVSEENLVALKLPQVIADCESGDRRANGTAVPNSSRHFTNDGSIVKNGESSATGELQIMASLHAENARSLGYDIYTRNGNRGFANHLYETQGATPWKASVECHGIY